MHSRLTTLDSSFLRVEGPSAHMHVAWAGLLTIADGRPRPTVAALRQKVGARLRLLPQFRQRLAFPPLRMGEPFWVDDPDFDVAAHVTEWSPVGEAISADRFKGLTDAVLSEPLDRSRPLWHIYLAPSLDDGRAGLVCKFHHAMVDGKSAVEVALLLFDSSPDTEPETPDRWSPPSPPNGARLALDTVVGGLAESLRAARGVARMAGSGGDASLAGTLRRAALAVEQDVLRPAPPSSFNVPIGPGRSLEYYSARMSDVSRARRHCNATVTDVCLAAVAGALRELTPARAQPRSLKVMVPVSMRHDGDRRADGNRISFTFIDLPIHLRSPADRLEHVVQATTAAKRSGRASGMEVVLKAAGALPDLLKDRAARVAASARTYNLTVSSIPGPTSPLYVLGGELSEAYPVVPLADNHALSIGVFGYRDRLFFGLYADPEALPEVRDLPTALEAQILSLARGSRRRARGDGGVRSSRRGDAAGTSAAGGDRPASESLARGGRGRGDL